MRTSAAMMFSQVAVPTQNLERWVVGPSETLEFEVEVGSSPGVERASVFGPTFVDMIDGEKPDIGFAATSTPSAVGVDGLLAHLVGNLSTCFLALGLANTTPSRFIVNRFAALNTLFIGTTIHHATSLLFGVSVSARFACLIVIRFGQRCSASDTLVCILASLFERPNIGPHFVQTFGTQISVMIWWKGLLTFHADVIGLASCGNSLVRLATFFPVHHNNIIANIGGHDKC